MNRKNILIGLAVAVFFSLVYLVGIFDRLGYQVYDFFLGFRPERVRGGDVVFLDVDDNAIAYNGVFPWPRSITAESLLRLKEYGARAAIFDIEYIDKGPPGVDAIYLNRGLPTDFGRSFSGINTAVSDIFASIRAGRFGGFSLSDINDIAKDYNDLINTERDDLFARAQGVARDNDLYMIQASALFGRSWASLNLREEALADEEQAGRRPIAEERFSYPVTALPNANPGTNADILTTLRGFALAAAGSGFTNVVVDGDGVRRRIDLGQKVFDHWYLQLAFAPLVNYLGNPAIELDSRKLVMRNAAMPDGNARDITIPLDGKGRMVLDWPKADYIHSYEHISFHEFSLLEDLESELEYGSLAFGDMDFPFFAQFDPELNMIPYIVRDLERDFDVIYAARTAALEDCDEALFWSFVHYRAETRELIRELLAIDPGARVTELALELAEAYPEFAGLIIEEAEYIANAAARLALNLTRYEEIRKTIEDAVRDKFCVLGRSDTGTTDIGTNPFHSKYVNVGTHAVVLDMILSETFITPVASLWLILFTVVFVVLFFLASAKFPPAWRAASGLVATILVIAASIALFRSTGIFFDPLLTVFSMITAVILREIISYAGSEREKQFIRKAFSTYVSDDVVKEILADPSRLQLGGIKRHMSAIFTDIKGFSTISEKLKPEQLVSLLNRYLTVMSDVVLEEMGTIDKYEGDAIIAFFGAPVDLPDHSLRACVSAVRMKRVEAELNRQIADENLSPSPLLTRVGINTGDMVAGNMGTENKMNYTIMGHAVNMAARLEGVNKQYGTWILASDDTIRETGGRFLTRRIDRVRVVGINEPVQLHEILDTLEQAEPEKKKLVELFHDALGYYEKKDWKTAMQGFRESYNIERGGPSVVYFKRCEAFLKNPPKEGWDGVINLTEK